MSRFEEIKDGDRLPELRVRMDREKYFAYNDLVKNINPLHSDEAYAKRLGFRDIVVAGVYTYSFITRMIEDWVGESGEISQVEIGYKSPIYIDETIIHEAQVIKKCEDVRRRYAECEVLVRDREGNKLTEALVRVDFN